MPKDTRFLFRHECPNHAALAGGDIVSTWHAHRLRFINSKPVSILPPVTPPVLLFQDLLDIFIGDSALHISFEDLTGFTMDSPELGLEVRHRQHCSDFCRFAKDHQTPARDCVRNKCACNRLAVSRRQGFAGMCHLGLMEAVEPLIVHGKLLGVFYFGSFVLEEQVKQAERRVRRFCKKNSRAIGPYLEILRRMPRLTEAAWTRERARFEKTVGVIRRIVEALDLPMGGYIPRSLTSEAMSKRSINALTLKALNYVQVHYAETCTLEMCAKQAGCHPVHLSRTFKREAGMDFHDHVHRVRIDHARRLLRVHAMNATRVGYEVGYADASHFTRVFKRLTGRTPAAFARDPQSA
jgi:AraC-like DNA-binding protein